MVLAMWIDYRGSVDALEAELSTLGHENVRFLGSVVDDGIVDVLIDLPSEVDARVTRDVLSRRLDENGEARVLRSWSFPL